jgi:hypothetical protein
VIGNGLATQITNRAALAALLEYLDGHEVEPYVTPGWAYAVTGSRAWFDWRTIWHVLSFMPPNVVQFNGGANGADCLTGSFWRCQGFPVREFPPNWKQLGKRAGHERNRLMMECMPKLVVAFLHLAGGSPGTRDAIELARERDIPTFVFNQAA